MAAKKKQTKEQARRKKLLQEAEKGIKIARKPVDILIPGFKVGEFAVEAATWLGPGGPAAKGVTKLGKGAFLKFMERVRRKAIEITPESKFAQRVGASKVKEISKGLGKGKSVHVEKTVVKGSKPTTARTASNRPTLSSRTRVGSKGAAAPKSFTKAQKDKWMKEQLKKAANKDKKRGSADTKKFTPLEGRGKSYGKSPTSAK